MSLEAAAATMREALKAASSGLIERELLVDLIALTAIAQEHLLVIGPPGTAKSEAVRRVAKALGGRYFEYLLGRFTEPAEIFGPIDLKRLREGVMETQTAGMLPEADIAFLDEVFLGSTAILNTLLGILNERVFRRGQTALQCPLRVCIGAANAIPDDVSLAAFSDRFLVRVFIEPIADSSLEHLLTGGWKLNTTQTQQLATLEHLDTLATAAKNADLVQVREPLAHAVRLLRKGGVALSDRRIVKAQRLIAAAAALTARTTATEADLWPIIYAVPTADQQRLAKEILGDLLSRSHSDTLIAATEAASSAPLARATRIADHAKTLLAVTIAADDSLALQHWKLRLEGIAREIDATFDTAHLPAPLVDLRAQLVRHLETP